MENTNEKRKIILSEASSLDEVVRMMKTSRRVILVHGVVFKELSELNKVKLIALKLSLKKYDKKYDTIIKDTETYDTYFLLNGNLAYNPTTDILVDANGTVHKIEGF